MIKSGKWTLVVIAQLRVERQRFNELRRGIGVISQKTLTSTLRELERDGFVSRTIYPSIPPRVDYELTELGQAFLEITDGWYKFIDKHRTKIEAARLEFDSVTGS